VKNVGSDDTETTANTPQRTIVERLVDASIKDFFFFLVCEGASVIVTGGIAEG
jgi:hypothetical protein